MKYTSEDFKGGYYLAPKAVLEIASIGAAGVFNLIYASCNKPFYDGEIELSKSFLCDKTKLSKHTLNKYLDELVQRNLITIQTQGKVSLFKINWEEVYAIFNLFLNLDHVGISKIYQLCTEKNTIPVSQIDPQNIQIIQKTHQIKNGANFAPINTNSANFAPISDNGAKIAPNVQDGAKFAPILNNGAKIAPIMEKDGANFAPKQNNGAIFAPMPESKGQILPLSEGDFPFFIQKTDTGYVISVPESQNLEVIEENGQKLVKIETNSNFSDFSMGQILHHDGANFARSSEIMGQNLPPVKIYKDIKKKDNSAAVYRKGKLVENETKEFFENDDETENLTEDKSPVKFNELLKWTERDLSKYDLLPANDLIEVFNKPEDYDLYQQTILREVLKDVLDTDRLTPVSVEEINSSNLTIPVSLFKRILYNVMEELQEKDLSLEMDEEAIKCMFGFPVLSPDTLQEPTFQIDLSQIRNVFWTEKRKVRKPKRSRYEERKRNILFMETLQETADRDIEILTNAEYATIKIFDLVDMRTENKQFHPDEFPALMFEKFIKDTAEESGVEEGDLQDLWKELPRRGGLVYLHPQQLSVDKILEYNHRHGEDSVVSKVWNERLEKQLEEERLEEKLEDDQLSQDDPD